jgi:hypothetical protein
MFVAKFEVSQNPHQAAKKPGGEFEKEKSSELAGVLFCQISFVAWYGTNRFTIGTKKLPTLHPGEYACWDFQYPNAGTLLEQRCSHIRKRITVAR